MFVVHWGCKTFNCLYLPHQHLELKITTPSRRSEQMVPMRKKVICDSASARRGVKLCVAAVNTTAVHSSPNTNAGTSRGEERCFTSQHCTTLRVYIVHYSRFVQSRYASVNVKNVFFFKMRYVLIFVTNHILNAITAS